MADKIGRNRTNEPIAVSFPLAGEWCPVTTPGHTIPSHGTDLLGQRYAYDFFQIDWSKAEGYKFYRTSTISSILFGVRLEDTFCWSQPIFSPFRGEVVETADGWNERNPVHFVRDHLNGMKNLFTLFATKASCNADLRYLLGNYIILKQDDIYSLIAHAKRNSILVSAGDSIEEGQKLAEVGHSGNSSSPHLHFQIMDTPELLKAKGLPCCFKEYRSFANGEWKKVTNGIPGKRERICA